MPDLQTNKLITAKEAETHIPPLNDIAGNGRIVGFFGSRLTQPLEGDPNIMIDGLPGTCKTVLVTSYLRQRFNNPEFGGEDIESARRWQPNVTEYDVRFFQTKVPEKIYAFVEIAGATDTRADIEHKVRDIHYADATHKFLFIDEAGELYFRAFDEMLRPLLTAPNITTYATAQNFHSKRRTDNRKEDDDRLRAFLRRFIHVFHTENPTADELIRLLIRRIKAWHLQLDAPSTLRLLVVKSGGVVGYALRALIKAIDEPDRRLTRSLVEEYDPDPVNR